MRLRGQVHQALARLLELELLSVEENVDPLLVNAASERFAAAKNMRDEREKQLQAAGKDLQSQARSLRVRVHLAKTELTAAGKDLEKARCGLQNDEAIVAAEDRIYAARREHAQAVRLCQKAMRAGHARKELKKEMRQEEMQDMERILQIVAEAKAEDKLQQYRDATFPNIDAFVLRCPSELKQELSAVVATLCRPGAQN